MLSIELNGIHTGATLFFLLGLAAYLVHVEERAKEHSHKCIQPEWYRRINKSNASLVATLMLATASFLSKETGITLLPVCLLYDLIRTKDSIRRSRANNTFPFKVNSIRFSSTKCQSVLLTDNSCSWLRNVSSSIWALWTLFNVY